MKHLTSCAMLFVLALASVSVLDISVSAAQGPPFVGTYFVTSTQDVASESVTSNMIITISADGNINILWSLGFTIQAGTAFTTEKGRWKQTGPQEIQARVLDFNFAYPSATHPKGVVGGTAVDDYTITIDGDGIKGTFSGRVFAPEVNPLNPGDIKPLFTFGGPFAGERVTLGK